MADDILEPEVDNPDVLFWEQMARGSRGPRIVPPPRYQPPPGIPLLDDDFEKDMGPPVDDNDANARKYLRDNLHVWVLMVRMALICLEKRQNFSFKMFVEIARWKHIISSHDSSTPFKLSNSYTAHISRYMRYFYPPISSLVEYHD